MPKKRQHLKAFKPTPTASPASGSLSNAAGKTSRSVNELLATLRHASLGPEAPRQQLPIVTPSVPPALRRFCRSQRAQSPHPDGSRGRGLTTMAAGSLPAHLPLEAGLLPGAVLRVVETNCRVRRRIAADWDIHREFNQYYLYYIPSHLKSALIRWIGIASPDGLSLDDLKLILIPSEVYGDGEDEDDASEYHTAVNAEVNYLDLSGALGRSLSLKEVSELLYPSKKQVDLGEPQESWDESEIVPSPPRVLLPNLTHLSLAFDPQLASEASWKQLLTMSSKLTTITHLSLAYWPDPCLTPRARLSTVTTPQGQSVAYGGTNYYSHSIDHDWSEALLVLRLLSKNLYALEFLDLTGCASWFKALMLHSEHDFVDWVGSWGKVTLLRIYTGWIPGDDAPPSEWIAYREALEVAANVERHIRTARAGKGRIITVERNKLDQ